MASQPLVTAIVLAAGLSTRMGGQPKPLLPFGESTIVEHILTVLMACPVHRIVLVTGHQHEDVERLLAPWDVCTVFNPQYVSGEMFSSIQVGLRAVPLDSDAALIVLGDQPALKALVVERVIGAYRDGRGSIVIPSFQMRRGHPILIGRDHWHSISSLEQGQTLRDYMRTVGSEIYHVEVNTPAILRDMDTPEDYRRELAHYAVGLRPP